jgi:hypothetical protein
VYIEESIMSGSKTRRPQIPLQKHFVKDLFLHPGSLKVLSGAACFDRYALRDFRLPEIVGYKCPRGGPPLDKSL